MWTYETRTDYSFLSRYHYNKSKNHLIRRYRIRHWIPMFIGTPCTYPSFLLYSHPSIVLTCSILIGQYFLSTLFLSFNTSNSPFTYPSILIWSENMCASPFFVRTSHFSVVFLFYSKTATCRLVWTGSFESTTEFIFFSREVEIGFYLLEGLRNRNYEIFFKPI